ncbi:hypothetical protein K435DRAFT_880675 [Dendrothele bispora CBS 962.96]|uniref:Uncharacterized protein n=1 Tax=Dendrothele bispora (strain CBS 962.96) TaxID=1314807 RepID=A0A4S8KJD7_DENBC|nr:hypothetical protein K435DRAFT_880675 [Dendrothele bispora CBS 962.96]
MEADTRQSQTPANNVMFIACLHTRDITGTNAKKIVCIAVGLRTESDSEGCVPWVDTFELGHDEEISDAWKSYLHSGSRHENRYGHKAATTIDEDRPLTVTVET